MDDSTFDVVMEALKKVLSAKSEIKKIHENRQEIYKLSTKLSYEDGYKLMKIYDESVKLLMDASLKIYKS